MTQLSQLAFVIVMAAIAPFAIRALACINHAYVNRKNPYSNKQKKRK